MDIEDILRFIAAGFIILVALVLLGVYFYAVFIIFCIVASIFGLLLFVIGMLRLEGNYAVFSKIMFNTSSIFVSIKKVLDKKIRSFRDQNAKNESSAEMEQEDDNSAVKRAMRILDLEGNPTVEEIEKAHHNLIKNFHPDKYPDEKSKRRAEAWAKDLNNARDILLKYFGPS